MLNPFADTACQMRTSLPLEACEDRIEALLSKRLRGHVTKTGYVLRRSGLLSHDNWFRPVAHCVLAPDGSGTRIDLRFRLSGLAKFWLIAWLAFIGVFVSVQIGVRLADGGQPTSARFLRAVETLQAGLVMGVFLLGMVTFARWLGRHEPDYIIATISDALGAEPAPGLPVD